MISRSTILLAQGHRCHYCGYQWPRGKASLLRMIKVGGRRAPTMDHLVPRSRGGQDTHANVVMCCQQCNSDKAHLTEEEFLPVRKDRKALLVARAQTLHLTQPEPR